LETIQHLTDYLVSGYGASYYKQYQGIHTWATAPSGTAGGSLTFTERMRITSGGNVAIGGTLGTDSQRIGYNSTSNNYFDGDNQYFRNGLGSINRMVIDSSGNSIFYGTIKSFSTGAAHLILNGDTNNSGDTGEVDAIIDLLGDGNPGLYGYRINTENWSGQTALNFQEYLNGSYTSRLFIRKDGNVGIGNTNPGAKLVVGATINSNASGIEVNAGASGGNVLSNGTADNWFPYVDNNNYYSASNHIFRSETNSSTRMTITSTGAIALGTSATAYGAAGEVLTSNGNASPSWQAAGGGGAWPQEKFAEYTIDSTTSNILIATMNSTTWHGNELGGCLKFTINSGDYIQVSYITVSTFLSGTNKWFFKGNNEMTTHNNGTNPIKYVFAFAGAYGSFGPTTTLKINRVSNTSNYTKVNVLVQAVSSPDMFILN
jgi:hypothetical protein